MEKIELPRRMRWASPKWIAVSPIAPDAFRRAIAVRGSRPMICAVICLPSDSVTVILPTFSTRLVEVMT